MEKIRMRGKWLIILYLISIFFSFVFVPYKLSPDVPVGHYYVFADTLVDILVVDYGRLVLQIMALTVLTLILYLWFYTTEPFHKRIKKFLYGDRVAPL